MRRSSIPPEFLPGRSYQVRRVEWRKFNGLCRTCAEPKLPESKCYCATCLNIIGVKCRQRRGFKAWRPGHRGRPPFPRPAAVVVVTEQEMAHA